MAGSGSSTGAPKVDLKRELADYRARRDAPQLVTVPDRRYLMIDGYGDPNTAAFATATAALYPLAYALKFAARAALGVDHVVMPLEGQWWAEDMASFTDRRDKTRWSWTLMILVPDGIGEDLLGPARAKVATRGPRERLDDVRLATLSEGTCVQALHVGSFDTEGDLLRRMHEEFLPAHGLALAGKHHEIYLSDPRRASPEKLRTILRQPVVPAR